jgi:hypothetical protein
MATRKEENWLCLRPAHLQPTVDFGCLDGFSDGFSIGGDAIRSQSGGH